MLPSKTQLITIGMTLAALYAIHNVDALKPAKDALNF